jgi:hypothetical protein
MSRGCELFATHLKGTCSLNACPVSLQDTISLRQCLDHVTLECEHEHELSDCEEGGEEHLGGEPEPHAQEALGDAPQGLPAGVSAHGEQPGW